MLLWKRTKLFDFSGTGMLKKCQNPKTFPEGMLPHWPLRRRAGDEEHFEAHFGHFYNVSFGCEKNVKIVAAFRSSDSILLR